MKDLDNMQFFEDYYGENEQAPNNNMNVVSQSRSPKNKENNNQGSDHQGFTMAAPTE